MVDVVVLSADMLLFDAIRAAIGERNPVWRARSAEESVDLLLTGRCGVLLIDLAVVSTQPATLVEQIVEQFPDVVVVVAGRRDDETLLAQLISDGLVYRFMHKPLSAKRAGMFLNAATRCHVERRDSSHEHAPLLPLAGGCATRDRTAASGCSSRPASRCSSACSRVLLGRRIDRAASPAAALGRRAPAAGRHRHAATGRSGAVGGPGRIRRRGATNPPPGATRSTSMRPCCSPTGTAGGARRTRQDSREGRRTGSDGCRVRRHRAEAQRLLGRLQATAPGDAATGRLAALLAPPPAAVVPDPPRRPTTYPSHGRSLRPLPSTRASAAAFDNAPYDTSHQLSTAGDAEAARDPATDRPRPIGGAIQ